MLTFDPSKHSKLAWKYLGEIHDLQVLRSGGGFYLGASSPQGEPISRDSQYFPSGEEAAQALTTGSWVQRANA